MKRYRREVRRTVAAWTGAYQYAIDQVLVVFLQLPRAPTSASSDRKSRRSATSPFYLTVHVMNYLHSGGYEVAL